MPHRPPTRSDSLAGSPSDLPPGSPRVRAAEPGELDRGTVVPRGVLDLIARDLAAGLAAEVVLLALWDRQGVVLLSSADAGRHVDSAVLARGFVGRALRLERAVVEAVDPRTDPSLAPLAAAGRVTHAIGAPVRPPQGLAGVLCAGFAGRPAGGSSAVWVVESYARLAALCLHDPAVLQDLLRDAREDALTGCLNFANLRKELSRETTRAGDALGRYGGDEFVAILPETEEAEARVLADRVRGKISATTALSAGEPVDASLGIAQWSPGWSAEAILEAADRALLAAKADGGGIVAASEPHLAMAQ